MPWGRRLVISAVGALLLVAVGWNVVRMVGGEYTWDGAGIVVAVVLAVLLLTAVLAPAMAFTSAVWVDQRTMELHRRLIGSEQVRSLSAPTTVELEIRTRGAGTVGLTSAFAGRQFAVKTPGEPTLRVGTPWVHSAGAVARQLQLPLEANPQLAADEETRQAILDPASIPGES